MKTGIGRAIVSNVDGSFRFAALPVGKYMVLIDAEGFLPVERGPIAVSIGGSSVAENGYYLNGHLYLRADINNVFNADTESGRFEDTVAGGGDPNLNYGRPSGFQEPRYVRLSARLVF